MSRRRKYEAERLAAVTRYEKFRHVEEGNAWVRRLARTKADQGWMAQLLAQASRIYNAEGGAR